MRALMDSYEVRIIHCALLYFLFYFNLSFCIPFQAHINMSFASLGPLPSKASLELDAHCVLDYIDYNDL